MIIFLYGPDTYRLQQKIREIINDYKKRHQDGVNFVKINFKEDELKELQQLIETVSMFDEKKLILIEGTFQQAESSQQELLDFLKKKKVDSCDESLILLWNEKKETKNKLFNFLDKIAKVYEFNLLPPYRIKEWVRNYTKNQGGSIENSAIEKLFNYVGNDLWRMTNELNKLMAFNKKINSENVENLVKSEVDLNIFATIDALAHKNKKQALRLLNEHLKQGDKESYLLDRFVYQFRNLLKAKSAFQNESNIRNINFFAKKINMHPFVAKKSLEQSRKFSFSELKKIYQKLLEIDLNIKTGKINPRTALEMFIINL